MRDDVALTAVLASGVTDKTPALMLVDELIERHGWTKLRALREAASLRRAARLARELADATELVDRSHPWRRQVEQIALEACGVYASRARVTFHLVAGREEPDMAHYVLGPNYRRINSATIRVGARWILREVSMIRVTVAHQLDADDAHPSPAAGPGRAAPGSYV